MPEHGSWNRTTERIITIIGFLIMFGGLVAGFSAKNAQTNARLNALEEQVGENKQELEDHNLGVIDHKLDEVDKKLDKIMEKLDIL